MRGFLFVRVLFIGAVVYVAGQIQPFEGHLLLNGLVGLLVALCIIAAEDRLKDVAVTQLLGGLIGFGIMLWVAKTLSGALYWANTGDGKVRFLHSLIIIVLPYLGLVFGTRRGEWLEPWRLMALFRDARPQKRFKILDTSVIIDGRIAEVAESGFVDGTLVVPQFVLKELQFVADSADPVKRNRGRRGLDVLNRIQKMAGVEVLISDVDFPAIKEVDMKLVELARTTLGKLVTQDFNLNKVAQLRGVEVLNLNDLTNALKPVVLPGEVMSVFIIKEGKEFNQGVAYLDDGTMVVVDNARSRIGRTLDIVVTSVLQTTAGRMIFGRHLETGANAALVERDELPKRRPIAEA
ncbi:MAG: PIN domain-containing protein [Vicinamibacterales bacterium]